MNGMVSILKLGRAGKFKSCFAAVSLFPMEDDSMRVIGGSFVFKGVTSPTEHNALSKVLRIAIYVHLSLILEQSFLSLPTVALKISKPRVPPSTPPYPTRPTVDPTPPSPDVKRKSRNSLLPSNIRSFFSKKAESILQRTTGLAPSLGRAGSLDLRPSRSRPLSPRSSEDNA